MGISKEYPEYGTYDVKAKEFYRKYIRHQAQVLGNLGSWALLQ